MASRGIVTLGTISALVGLVACGSVTGGTGHPAATGTGQARESPAAAHVSAGEPLCADPRTVDRVVMRLTVSQPREFLPRAVMITDPSRLRALAAGLCMLPLMPRALRCPAELGGALRLEFAAGDRSYHPVRIQDSGCASVTGLGPARQWAWSSRPGQLLSKAAGSQGRLVAGTHPSSVPTP